MDDKPCPRKQYDFIVKTSYSYKDGNLKVRCTHCKGLTFRHPVGRTVHERMESELPDDFGSLYGADEHENTRMLQGHIRKEQKRYYTSS